MKSSHEFSIHKKKLVEKPWNNFQGEKTRAERRLNINSKIYLISNIKK